jgi:cyclopropane-fatty-acyl-phospholipid synthase
MTMLKILRALFSRVVREGTLEVETACGHRFAFGNGKGDRLAIRLTDAAAERQLVFDPSLAFGELYMDGRLLVEQGTLFEVLALLSRNLGFQDPPGLAKALARVRRRMQFVKQRNGAVRAKRNVEHHYDLDRRLYSLFLDPDLQYSCAYFDTPGIDLAEAQLAKKRHLAAKLLLQPGQRVLDIGSGWGGLALYLARCCAVDVTGVTLSEEQLNVARSRVRKDQITHRVRFELQDYRDVSNSFDRIVSVGMFEHVGVSHYPTFFDKAAKLLTDDGVMLLHSIGRMDGPGITNPWMSKYIFPGGYTPALSEVLPAIERAGLIVTDIEILRVHYAETLKAWRERFLARRDDARVLYDERFCRMWEFYLAGCESAFRYSGLMVFQIQIAKRQEAVPLTRDYISQREAALRAMDRSAPSLRVAAE